MSFKVVFSPDGQRLATACDDNAARIWDDDDPEEILTLRGHTREVHSVAFSSDGRRLATQSMDGTVKIWDAVQDEAPADASGPGGALGSSRGIQPGRSTDRLRRYRRNPQGPRRGEWSDIARIHGAHRTDRVRGVQPGRENDRDRERELEKAPRSSAGSRSWDAGTGAVIRTLHAHVGMVLSVAFSPDGSRLATAGGEHVRDSGAIKIWDTKTWTEIRSLEGHSKGRVRVAYSPDGRFLASVGWDSRVIIWDANTGLPLHPPLQGHGDTYLLALAFSRDGARLATAGIDGVVIVWDTATGQEVGRFLGHKTIVWSVAFSPDGTAPPPVATMGP